MKRSIKLVICMLLVATIALPTVFATGLGESSKIVKVGTVDNTDVNYNVDIKWGSLVYNFVKSNDSSIGEYIWEPEKTNADVVEITNYSNVIINADVEFTSSMANVIGFEDTDYCGIAGSEYQILTEEPEDFNTETYYVRDEEGRFVEKGENTTFEADKYYKWIGAGGGPSENRDIPSCTTNLDGVVHVSSLMWKLKLEGGSLTDVRPGATIGTVTVTLS